MADPCLHSRPQARSPSAHGSELGSDAASNQDRLSSRNASSATSKSSKSDRIELHWDDGTTETDTDWNVDATNAHHDRDDDGCSIATDSALSVASSSGMSSLTVKSSILNKFMNYATGVWQKDVFTEDDDLKADSRAQYDDSRSQYDSSLVTSVSAGITNCEVRQLRHPKKPPIFFSFLDLFLTTQFPAPPHPTHVVGYPPTQYP